MITLLIMVVNHFVSRFYRLKFTRVKLSHFVFCIFVTMLCRNAGGGLYGSVDWAGTRLHAATRHSALPTPVTSILNCLCYSG